MDKDNDTILMEFVYPESLEAEPCPELGQCLPEKDMSLLPRRLSAQRKAGSVIRASARRGHRIDWEGQRTKENRGEGQPTKARRMQGGLQEVVAPELREDSGMRT